MPRPGVAWTALTIDVGLQVRRVTISLHLDLGERIGDALQVLSRELNLRRAKVLFEPVELGRTGNGNNPRLLRKEPRQRDLRTRHFPRFRNLAQQINQLLIRFASFR